MIRKIAIIGMGALGLLYADQLTRGLGDMDAVQFVMDKSRLARHSGDQYTINGQEKHFRIVCVKDAEPVDLCIVAVKYTALSDALETMAPVIGPKTILMSVMNGVTSEVILARRYPRNPMLITVAQGMDAMRSGSHLRYTRCGALHIGVTDEENLPALEAVERLFKAAQVPYVREADILRRLWFKFMLNVGVNQACMVFDTNYGVVTTPGTEANEKMVGAMREVIPIAAAHGVRLTEADVQQCIDIERSLDPEGYPSMAQDRRAGRKSEVEMFAGDVLRMSREIGLDAPYNRFLYDRVKEIERDM